ncbi:MAG: helix-turn-helix transcriptional regulator [Phycisphaerales bacterium]|nr:MAG: helix-turn-helix transcriptional regulator [Phycisphaerales bacterium]
MPKISQGQRNKSSEKGEKKLAFVERVRALREARGLTQEELAERVGVSKSAVVEWEAGRNLPRCPNMRALCEELNATELELRGDERLDIGAEFRVQADVPALRSLLEEARAGIEKALSALNNIEGRPKKS